MDPHMSSQKTASASGKLILSGEYAVLFGHPGIAVPVSMKTQATWEDTPDAPMRIQLRGQIGDERFARRIVDQCATKGGPMTGMLTIQNDVPVGKGMGSSTALVIAIGKCLLGDDARADILSIEDTVNPGHSGLDFSVMWNDQPTLFIKGSAPKTVDLDLSVLKTAVLIDTGIPLEPTPQLVALIKTHSNGDSAIAVALQTIGACTERLLAGEPMMTVFPNHHRAQVELGVVPIRVQNLIREIERNDGAAKIVGAGGRAAGAGMVLALHTHPAIPKKLAEKFMMPCYALSTSRIAAMS